MNEHQELVDRFLEVVDILIKLERQIKEIDENIARLNEQGTTSATVHWRRKDDTYGRPDMLELVHRSGSGYEHEHGRRREYIGTEPKQIKAALARCRRFDQVRDLKGERARLMKRADNIKWAIKNVFRVAGEEKDLWGHQETPANNLVSPSVLENNGDNGEWGQDFGSQAECLEMSPQPRVNVSPRGFVPKDMGEVRTYFEQHSDPFLQSLANDIGKPR